MRSGAVRGVAPVEARQGIENLVALLDEVWHQRGVRLCPVPGATLPQCVHEGGELRHLGAGGPSGTGRAGT